MEKLTFKLFMERFKIQYESSKRHILNYKEYSNKFILYFKNTEYWEYYTEVLKDEIINFGSLYGVSEDTAIEDFRMNYLTHAVKVEVDDELEQITESKEENIINEQTEESCDCCNENITKLSKQTNPDIEDESQDYETFFIKQVNKWEDKVIDSLKYIDIEKSYQPELSKTFGEFIQNMFNAITTREFFIKIKKYIKNSMVEGIEAVEEEINVNIGWNETFDNKLNSIANQQLEGYTIGGKKWYGIKGATAELRLEILKSVEEDLKNKLSQSKMAENIREIFQGSTISQAKRIARTETNRMVNESKLMSYKESGIKGRKAWSIVPKNCCDICVRLNNKYNIDGIPFDEPFVDDVTGKSGQIPIQITHPNCRCTIEYRAELE